MISNIRNSNGNVLGASALGHTSNVSDGRSMNRVRSFATQAPQDVMERSAMSTSTPVQAQSLVDLRGTLGGIANILQGLLGAAGELFGAVTNGLKKILDAGTGIFGLVGNVLSQALTRFSG